ncbi:MAG: DNA-processing protein DprA [Reichenbachiella sp.]
MVNNLGIQHALTIISLKGIGRKKAFKIAADFLKSENVIELRKFLVDHKQITKAKISSEDIETSESAALELIGKSNREGIGIVSFYDDNYPQMLKNISDPPFILNYKGNIKLLNELGGVAIIGTRKPTKYGYAVSERLAQRAVELNLNVVSGLAIGCDEAAHSSALKSEGITTAVLAHGLDTIYPIKHKELANQIVKKGGLLISEYFVGQKSQPSYFVERDRIQAGLSKGVVVVEADVDSGTMHTVGYAKEYKRFIAAFEHPREKLEGIKVASGNRKIIDEKIAVGVGDTHSLYKFFYMLLDFDNNMEKIIGFLNTQIESREKESIPHWRERFEEILELSIKNGKDDLLSNIELNHIGSFQGYDYAAFFPYYSNDKAYNISERDENIRSLIFNFKGKKTFIVVSREAYGEYIAIAIENFLNLKNLTLDDSFILCCIPASTRVKTNQRFKDFCKFCSGFLNVENGFDAIAVFKDRDEVKINRSQNRLEGVSYSKELKGRNIILFDDIITTGKSFGDHADHLINIGAKSVVGFFLGKTVH